MRVKVLRSREEQDPRKIGSCQVARKALVLDEMAYYPPIKSRSETLKALPREGEFPPQAAAALCYLQKESGVSASQRAPR